ncbi:MAG TPA: DinB family protein [Ktedonobacteraceae bacterium]|nr:DinB family protein [Ktedonobacteraceae bacterium]
MPVPTPKQLDAYEMAPSSIMAALEGLDEAQIRHTPAENAWSIHEIVIHLADSEAVGYMRLRMAIAEDNPLLPVYAEAEWAQRLKYNAQARGLALALFANLRAASAALLRALPAEEWERIATHPERGRMSVCDLFDLYSEHGEIHLQQIEHIKQTFKA